MRDNTPTMTATPLPPAAHPALLPPPGRLRRFACMMYEGVLLFAVVFLAGYLFDTLTQSPLAMKTWHIKLTHADGQPAGLARLAARYVLCWPLPLAGAAVIAAASRAVGWPSLDMLIVATPFLNFLWTWVDREQLFLHDRLLGTRLHSTPFRSTHVVSSTRD